MRKSLVTIGLLMSALVGAHAHTIPIYPVDLKITVDSHELTAEIRMQAGYMYDMVLFNTIDPPLPATAWPPATVASARSYIEKCLTLQLNGRPLTATTFEPRFIQEPLRSGAWFVFRLRYPMEASQGRLAGRATFFADYKAADTHGPEASNAVAEQFITYLTVAGRETVHFELPLEKPDFDLALDGMARTASARFIDQARQMSFRVISNPVFWVGLVFVLVAVIKKWKKKKHNR